MRVGKWQRCTRNWGALASVVSRSNRWTRSLVKSIPGLRVAQRRQQRSRSNRAIRQRRRDREERACHSLLHANRRSQHPSENTIARARRQNESDRFPINLAQTATRVQLARHRYTVVCSGGAQYASTREIEHAVSVRLIHRAMRLRELTAEPACAAQNPRCPLLWSDLQGYRSWPMHARSHARQPMFRHVRPTTPVAPCHRAPTGKNVGQPHGIPYE